MTRWPYPRILAHRGGGTLAPENTLAAIEIGWGRGFRAVEFDVMLTLDEVPVLMHDAEFGRTVRGPGSVSATPAATLATLDAGSWYGAAFAAQTVPFYEDVVRFCRAHGIFMNVEIKPAPGFERRTGEVVADVSRRLYADAADDETRPLFSSFSSEALAAAAGAAPEFARGHLFDQVPTDWQARLAALECVSLHCNHRFLGPEMVRPVMDAGLGIFCYTVNTIERARELLVWGVDAFCTDRIDLIGADFYGAVMN